MQGLNISSFKRTGWAIMALCLAALPAHAANDALIEGGKLCTQQFPLAEGGYNIPTHLLAAISTTESGRWHDGLGMAVPWPWTINVDGKGYYFNSKAEAIAATQRFQAQGHQSIDVGCMQVNLKHHANAFANLNQAFDPASNVAYAAKFLHDNYAELGDWIKATAAYHSRTESRGREYLAQIERSWNRIVAKVAAARANQGTVVTATASPKAASAQIISSNNEKTPAIKPLQVAAAAPNVAPMRPIASTHNVQVIHVNASNVSPKSDVLVIRGTEAGGAMPVPAPVKSQMVASAASTQEEFVSQPAGDSVRRVSLDNPAPSAQRKPASYSSTFVFAN